MSTGTHATPAEVDLFDYFAWENTNLEFSLYLYTSYEYELLSDVCLYWTVYKGVEKRFWYEQYQSKHTALTCMQ